MDDDSDLQDALRLSLADDFSQEFVDESSDPVPDPKRNRTLNTPSSSLRGLSTDMKLPICEEDNTRRQRREILAAAAEKRLARNPVLPIPRRPENESCRNPTSTPSTVSNITQPAPEPHAFGLEVELSPVESYRLYSVVFGEKASDVICRQWSNQGFRFSDHKETSWGMVQLESGPCGVLAPVQAVLLKQLLFGPHWAGQQILVDSFTRHSLDSGTATGALSPAALSRFDRSRALASSLAECLWRAGQGKEASIAIVSTEELKAAMAKSDPETRDNAMVAAMGGVLIDSAASLQKLIRVMRCPSLVELQRAVSGFLAMFQSSMGALLLLFSALLSRTLAGVEVDRDDSSQPLITQPFGHASQEIVNLLLCGHAVPNVFDGDKFLEGGMCLKGIPCNVEVGFLTILEYLSLCEVGQKLKNPQWPVWVIASESHYTVLFSATVEPLLSDEGPPSKEVQVKEAFDRLDSSGGGGFISPENLSQLASEMDFVLPANVVKDLTSSGIVLWNELGDALCQLEEKNGGFKGIVQAIALDKCFTLFHFNGLAKFDVGHAQGGSRAGESTQRPRLTTLEVRVPPPWDLSASSASAMAYDSNFVMPDFEETSSKGEGAVSEQKHAPLVDCIRTRWKRAACNWLGDAPSIV